MGKTKKVYSQRCTVKTINMTLKKKNVFRKLKKCLKKKCNNSVRKGSLKKCLKQCLRSKRNKRTKRSKTRKTKTRRKRMRGGYGKPACPFVGSPWSAGGGGDYYKLSSNGIGVGGSEPFSGNNSPSPQHGGSGLGLMNMAVYNPSRVATGGLANLYNMYAGQPQDASPLPTRNQYASIAEQSNLTPTYAN
jgi:hypothetical protein